MKGKEQYDEIKGNETGSYLSDWSHCGRLCIQSSQRGQKGNDQREEKSVYEGGGKEAVQSESEGEMDGQG